LLELDRRSLSVIFVLAGILVTGLGGLRWATKAGLAGLPALYVGLFCTASTLTVTTLAAVRTARTLSWLQQDWMALWGWADYLWALTPYAVLVVVGLRAPGNAPAALWALSGALAVAALAFAGHAVIFNVTTLRALPAVLLTACGLIIVTRLMSFRDSGEKARDETDL
jgi:hypothetical protein